MSVCLRAFRLRQRGVPPGLGGPVRLPRDSSSVVRARSSSGGPLPFLDANFTVSVPSSGPMWKSRCEAGCFDAGRVPRGGAGAAIQCRPPGQARSSGGERYLDTVEVGGSNPPAPTIPPCPAFAGTPAERHCGLARRGRAPKFGESLPGGGWPGLVRRAAPG